MDSVVYMVGWERPLGHHNRHEGVYSILTFDWDPDTFGNWTPSLTKALQRTLENQDHYSQSQYFIVKMDIVTQELLHIDRADCYKEP